MALIKLSNNGVKNITSVGSVGTGDLVFISKQTASSSASIEFTLGDYKEYQFYFVDIHPQTSGVAFQFNMSTDSGANYNVIKTSTSFIAYHAEAGNDSTLSYSTGTDLAQSTGEQSLLGGDSLGGDADQIFVGKLQIFNPSSTTYVKHYISKNNFSGNSDYNVNSFQAGYGNTTSAINSVRFKMSSGNIDAGDILLYGVN